MKKLLLRISLLSALAFALPFVKETKAADISSGYRVSLGGPLNVPATVMLCPSSDGSFTAVACSFSGGGGGGSVTQGTIPWADNISQFGGTAVSLGQNTMAASMPVAIANNQSTLPVALVPSVTTTAPLAVGFAAPAAFTTATGTTAAQTTAAGSSLVLKTSAGLFYDFNAVSTSAADLVLINATAAPASGATLTPTLCVSLAANVSGGYNATVLPKFMSTGITALVTTGGCFTYTPSATAFISGDYK